MEKVKLSAVVMASGHSKRFKGDKLTAIVDGVPMIEKLFMAIPEGIFDVVAVVSRDERILDIARGYGYRAVFNDDKTDDTAITIKLGVENIDKDSKGCAFFVGDQPWLRGETITALAERFYEDTSRICMLSHEGHKGNPVIFPAELFGELKTLLVNEQGKVVIRRHPEKVVYNEVEDANELRDIDYASDLNISAKA
ncbi:MAG: nucleotidyltransferase family protein [Lachnospiraceae bacterium]|nr:nucleotidyltransferase family protein [Lachnospiraceae bacterium]